VLGGGGFVGGAWMLGALTALAERTAWDPRGAEVLVGTSAGAVLAALLGAGQTPAEILRTLTRDGGGSLTPAAGFRLRRALPVPLPASPRLALEALRRQPRLGPLARVAAWMPSGPLSSEPLAELLRGVVPEGWVEHPRTWITAYDLAVGRRAVFGREEPAVDLADAVTASCAIPGLYHPVTIGGHRYVDGGVCSPSNLDVLADAGVDLAICLNPTSSLELGAAGWWGRLGNAVRRLSGSYLAREATALRRRGVEVLLLQPSASDIAVMGLNLMRTDGLADVVESARATTAARLEALGGTRSPVALRLLRPARTPRRAALAPAGA
jgi:NTE family protein